MTFLDICRLAIRAHCSPETVRRWLKNPGRVNDYSRSRILAAVRALGMSELVEADPRRVLHVKQEPSD